MAMPRGEVNARRNAEGVGLEVCKDANPVPAALIGPAGLQGSRFRTGPGDFSTLSHNRALWSLT
jgi:hypothetical protein